MSEDQKAPEAEAEAEQAEPTHTYAPWQQQEVRRQLRMAAGGEALSPETVAEVIPRAAKMASLPTATVRFLCEKDDACVAIITGKPVDSRASGKVHAMPAPPAGPEGR